MRKTTRLSRALLLESLEARAVFCVAGHDVLNFAQPALPDEARLFQPAQFQRSELRSTNGNKSHAIDLHRDAQIGDTHIGQRLRESSQHRRHFEFDLDMPPPEGEGRPFDSTPSQANSSPLADLFNQAREVGRPSLLLLNSFARPTAEIVSRIEVDSSNLSGSNFLSGNNLSGNNLSGSNLSGNSNGPINQLANGVAGSALLDRLPNAQSAGNAMPVIATSSAVAQDTLALLSQPILFGGTATFDFSASHGNNSEPYSSIDNQRFGEPQLSKARSSESDAIFDPSLTARGKEIDPLESVLSDLSADHGRPASQFVSNADLPSSRSDQGWREKQAAAPVDYLFADGGMIALTLNRDTSLRDLEEMTDEARNEGKAWIANVGIYRAFENAAVAATEYASLTNRTARSTESPANAEVSEVEGPLAGTDLRPSVGFAVALGVLTLGFRRFRKIVPLMYKGRNVAMPLKLE